MILVSTTRPADVVDVAEHILATSGEMTTMKLHKLLYYSQAWHLAWDGVPMFDDQIQAWANGPVVPAIYVFHRGQFRVKPGFFYAARQHRHRVRVLRAALPTNGALRAVRRQHRAAERAILPKKRPASPQPAAPQSDQVHSDQVLPIHQIVAEGHRPEVESNQYVTCSCDDYDFTYSLVEYQVHIVEITLALAGETPVDQG